MSKRALIVYCVLSTVLMGALFLAFMWTQIPEEVRSKILLGASGLGAGIAGIIMALFKKPEPIVIEEPLSKEAQEKKVEDERAKIESTPADAVVASDDTDGSLADRRTADTQSAGDGFGEAVRDRSREKLQGLFGGAGSGDPAPGSGEGNSPTS